MAMMPETPSRRRRCRSWSERGLIVLYAVVVLALLGGLGAGLTLGDDVSLAVSPSLLHDVTLASR